MTSFSSYNVTFEWSRECKYTIIYPLVKNLLKQNQLIRRELKREERGQISCNLSQNNVCYKDCKSLINYSGTVESSLIDIG